MAYSNFNNQLYSTSDTLYWLWASAICDRYVNNEVPRTSNRSAILNVLRTSESKLSSDESDRWNKFTRWAPFD